MKVRYIQPADNEDGFEEVIVTINEAIRLQREYVAKVRPDFVYKDDEQALQDYLTVHWAEIISG
jgi:hypothetical protein